MDNLNMITVFIGAVYLKNLINSNWVDREVEPGSPLHFTIHEQDRAMIRDAVVDAVVLAPELIRYKADVMCSKFIVKKNQI